MLPNNSNVKKTFRGNKFILNLLNLEVVELITDDDIELTLEDAKEIVSEAYNFNDGQKKLNLIVVGNNTSATIEAIQYFSGVESENVSIADAVIINSLGQRILLNFLIKLIKGRWPIKAFADKDEALKWLIQQK